MSASHELNIGVQIAFVAIFAAVFGLNLIATSRCLKDKTSLKHERIGQLLLVWLLPVGGTLLLLHLLKTNPEVASGTYREAPNVGDEYVLGGGKMNERGYIRSPDEVMRGNASHLDAE